MFQHKQIQKGREKELVVRQTLNKIANHQFVSYSNTSLSLPFERELCHVLVTCVHLALVICNFSFVNIISQDDVDVNPLTA